MKHVADLPRREKTVYLHRLPERLSKVLDMLAYVRVFNSVDRCSSFIETLNPLLVLVDDRLYSRIQHPRRVRESRVRETHRRRLVMLADNIAYYACWATEEPGRPASLKDQSTTIEGRGRASSRQASAGHPPTGTAGRHSEAPHPRTLVLVYGFYPL